MKKLHEMWLRLPLNYRKEIVSFTHTFLGVFGSIVMLGIADAPWTSEALIALLIAGVRAGIKAGWNRVARYKE
jgi:hypothetical protein